MSVEAIPYMLLACAIFVAWDSRPRYAIAVLGVAIISALWWNRISWISLPSIGALGLSLWVPTRFANRGVKTACYAGFLIFAVLMSNYVLPGFHNLPVFQGVRFSPDSAPFNMYLNFDKGLVGLFVLLFLAHWRVDARTLKVAGLTLAVLVLVMMPIALGIGYVRLDIKFPGGDGLLWMTNNLFLVCFAEEGLFRGFIQGQLEKARVPSAIAISIAAALFGLAHFKGGVTYIALAFVAGLFYGFAFHRTKQLSSSVCVHFGLNLIHFLFFSYPSLQT